MSWASIAQKAPPKAAKEEEEAAPAPAPPHANGIATTARPAAASVPVAAQSAAYEPAPNEIKSVVLSKPTTDAVLGIRLAGRERLVPASPPAVRRSRAQTMRSPAPLLRHAPRRALTTHRRVALAGRA